MKAVISIFSQGCIYSARPGQGYRAPDSWQSLFSRAISHSNEQITLKVDPAAVRLLNYLERTGYEITLVAPAPGRYLERLLGYLAYPVDILSGSDKDGYGLERPVIIRPWTDPASAQADTDWEAAQAASADLYIGAGEVVKLLAGLAPNCRCFTSIDECGRALFPAPQKEAVNA